MEMKRLFKKKYSLLVTILLVAVVVAGTASVYVFYYVNTTATVQSPDLKLYAGTDASASCTAYPCATVSVSNYDQATVSLSIFPSPGGTPPIPATYYTNLTVIKNTGTATHTISAIELGNFAGLTYLGNITVYYCSTQTEFNLTTGLPISPCVGSASITSSSSHPLAVLSKPVTLTPNETGYIEVVGYAGSRATAGTVIFTIAIQWS